VTEASHFWYMRPVFYVSNIGRAIDFYVGTLAFTKKWQQDIVCQVDRGDGEIILFEDAKRTDKGRLFIELTPAGREQLQREIAERSIPFDKFWWGYDCIRIVDPDGNELLFPLED
jgi:hypothetical protein